MNSATKRQRTLSIVKPDGVRKGVIGEVVRRFEASGIRVVAMRMLHLTKPEAEGFYAVHRERPFFGSLTEFMSSGPIVAMVLEGENVIARNRELMGATNPKDAKNKLGAGIQVSSAGVLDAKGQMPPAQAPKPDYSQRKADFLVISYEGLELVKFNVLMPLFTEKVIPAGCWQDNLGRVIYPAGLPLLLKECSRYPIPLFVQLSIADAEGKQRGAYLTEHVKAIQMALGDGCQVSGLFYDSLLDGFGYNYGYSLKTGLLKVNTTIQERKPAGGATVFRGLALSNGSNPVPLNMKRPRRGKPPAR